MASSELPRITHRPVDLDALEREFEQDLSSGRLFVAGASAVGEREPCELELVHPTSGAVLRLPAESVWVQHDEPGLGVGLELTGFDDDVRDGLRAFIEEAKEEGPAPSAKPGGDNVYARVKAYTTAEQMRAAREGDFPERVALERVYGKSLWEILLHNRRITAPEVSRMARNPKLPKHLIDTIAGNPGWLASSDLRDALLRNPQLAGMSLDKTLRAAPRLELTRIARQAAYPMKVRQAAKKLQGR